MSNDLPLNCLASDFLKSSTKSLTLAFLVRTSLTCFWIRCFKGKVNSVSGPISDLADIYNLDDEDSQLTPMGQTNASGRISLLSSNILRDAIKAIKDSRDVESKKQQDYYAARGKTSGTIDEEKIELDADTEFTLPLKHLIQKHVKEVLTKKAKVSDFVDDFKKSDAKQFKGKSLDKIKKMALAAFLSKQKK